MTEAPPDPRPRPIRILPDALERMAEIRERLASGEPALFLDFDGTLAPIVEEPDRAAPAPESREALRRLADRWPVAVLSGRDVDDVRERLGLDGIWYGGSHGFELLGPDGSREERGLDHLPELDRADAAVRRALEEHAGVAIERKRFAIAVHHRRASDEVAAQAAERVCAVAGDHPGLSLSRGKEVLELRPDVDWDKGSALSRMLRLMGIASDRARPLSIGDDVTDEDAFEAVAGQGIAVVVRGESDLRRSRADYALECPTAVGAFLEELIV